MRTHRHKASVLSPARFDTVGSFLRPRELLLAKEDFRSGKISREAMTKAEDDAVRSVVRKQIDAGLRYVGDGEFRRDFWHLDFIWALNGISEVRDETAYRAHSTDNRAAVISGRVSCGDDHPALRDYAFLSGACGGAAEPKTGIPSPAQCLTELTRSRVGSGLERVYGGDLDALARDIAEAYRIFLRRLYDLGCRRIQFDDCVWCCFCVKDWRERTTEMFGLDRNSLSDLLLGLTNDVIDSCPNDMTVVEHICCGAYHAEWESIGGYTDIAEFLFPRLRADWLHLKFDTGPMEPLSFVPDDVMVSIGIVDAKSPSHDYRSSIIAALERAAELHSPDRLCLSTQCGFSSSADSCTMPESMQWEKIALMREITNDKLLIANERSLFV